MRGVDVRPQATNRGSDYATAQRRARAHHPAPMPSPGGSATASTYAERGTRLNLDRQDAIVEALLDHVVIGPGTPGARMLDLSRVSPCGASERAPRRARVLALRACARRLGRLRRPAAPPPDAITVGSVTLHRDPLRRTGSPRPNAPRDASGRSARSVPTAHHTAGGPCQPSASADDHAPRRRAPPSTPEAPARARSAASGPTTGMPLRLETLRDLIAMQPAAMRRSSARTTCATYFDR